jgi:transposase
MCVGPDQIILRLAGDVASVTVTLSDGRRDRLTLYSDPTHPGVGLAALEFLEFMSTVDTEVPKALAVHIILANYATHKHKNVKTWLAKHPRFHLHFTPTSSSWLNLASDGSVS